MKGLRFTDAQESRFEAWNRSYMGSAILQVCRLADLRELCFQPVKRSDMECSKLQGGKFSDSQESIYRLRNIQMWVLPTRKVFDFLLLRNGVFRLRIVQI